MELVINGKVIDAPIDIILRTLRTEIGGLYLRDIGQEYKDNIPITCPKHKDGREKHPSCNVYTKKDDEKTEYGKVHCFTCGFTSSLAGLVGVCFNEDEDFGNEWLIERFGTSFSENSRYLPEITLNRVVKKEYLDQSILDNYNYYHPYMFERKLTKDIIRRFRVGYDDKHKCITFPVWDERNNLVLVTSRSVIDKSFYIDEDKEKPVYLLNFINEDDIKTVYVCESQINALTLWSWGYPAIALIGTGSSTQYDILNKSSIRNYILCFDGDEAGDKGIKRFTSNIRKDVFISHKVIPRGKDVNDLTKEQFDTLQEVF